MKTPTINSRIVKLEVLKGTATRTSVNAVESRTTSLESDVTTLTQGIQDAVSTHNTAPDSHADLRTLIGDRALSMHQHARTDLPWISDPGAALLTAESASAQRTALGMTAWAVAPWTDGTTSDIPEGTQLYFTNARADARIAAQKGQAEGIMPLDSSGKAPLAYMPDALIGQVKFKGVWDAATNSPVLPSATTSMGHYYVTSVAGSYGGIDYGVGDWCISDGTTWGKVDNSDAITSFAGRVGAILPISSDYSAHYLGLHAQADDAAKLGGQLPSYYSQAGHVHNYSGSSTPGGAATTALACTGNAATATALATARLINGTSFNGSSDVIVSKIYDANYVRIVNPDGGTLLSYGTETGAIAIRLPNGFSNTMVSFSGTVYNYLTNKSFTFSVHGYCYENGSWFGTSAQVCGFPEVNLGITVRFGRLADLSPVVYIGELDSAWTYPQVSVNNVFCTWDGFSPAWAAGWQITFESNAFLNVSAAATNCQVGYRPANVFTGAKVIGETTYNFVNGLLVS